jgi:hypothetical protein
MQITITDDALLIMMGLLSITLFPYIYLFLIFTMMTLIELIEHLGKIIHKFVKITIEYIFPIAIIFLFYLAIIHVIGFA